MTTRLSHYLYNGEKYYTVGQVRKAIWDTERKLFARQTTDAQLISLGVEPVYVEYSEPVESEEQRAEREAQEKLQRAKDERAFAVEHIIVEVDGMRFDGDEVSQGRMSRMLVALQAMNAPAEQTITWVLADNTVAQVNQAQLAEALVKAGMEQSALWTVPYEDDAE